MTLHTGNDQNQSSGMSEEDYSLNAARTIPEPFGHLDMIPTDAFYDALFAVSAAGQRMDHFKKALVYGREVPVLPPEFVDNGHPVRMDSVPIEVLHGIIGTITEACELADLLLTTIFGGDDFDEINLKEELGDLKWYEDRICRRMGWSHGDIRAGNIAKLFHRHKVRDDGQAHFDATQADHANRDKEGERSLVQGAELLHATEDSLRHALEHSLNYHGYDAKLDMPDYAIAAKLSPEMIKHLKGETSVQVFERMSPEERAQIGVKSGE